MRNTSNHIIISIDIDYLTTMPRDRRGLAELTRDILLVLYAAPDKTEKPTRLMYGSNLSWVKLKGGKNTKGVLPLMLERGFVDKIQLDPNRKNPDARSNVLYKITRKGEIMLRFLDAMLIYLEGKEPDITIPLPILRNLYRARFGGIDVIDAMFNDMAADGMSLITENLGQPVVKAEYVPYLEVNRRKAAQLVDLKMEDVEEEIVELIPGKLPDGIDEVVKRFEEGVENILEEVEYKGGFNAGVEGRVHPVNAERLAKAAEDMSDEEFADAVLNLVDETPEKDDVETVNVKSSPGWMKCPYCPVYRNGRDELAEHVLETHGRRVEWFD